MQQKTTRREHSPISRVLAALLAFVLVLSALPGAALTAKAAESYDVTVHFENVDNWTNVSGYRWVGADNNGWPGEALEANAKNDGWYDFTVENVPAGSDLGVIFNNGGSGSQTNDLMINDVSADGEYWVVEENQLLGLTETAPEGWVYPPHNITVHFENVEGWSAVMAHYWDAAEETTWPGKAMTATAGHENWYDITLTDVPHGNNVGFVFNANSSPQTTDIRTGAVLADGEYWVTKDSGWVIATTAPESWDTPVERETCYYVAGEEALCGSSWSADDANNQMTEKTTGVYEKVYENVAAGEYEIKVTDGSWTNSWGNGSENLKIAVTALSTVTITFTEATKAIDVKVEPVTPPVDYYLFGYINGANYACEEDYENLGEYKFVNGKMKATFTQTSYVAVKTGDNAKWYMTDGWAGEVKSVTLSDKTGLAKPDKLIVPAGVELTFTLVENQDGTLTLSYAVPAVDPIQPEKIIVAGNGADLGEGKWLNGSGWAPGEDKNQMTETSEGIYEITFADVPYGKGYAFKFAANGDWDALANWGGTFSASGAEFDAVAGGGNITFDVLYESADVTLKLDLTQCDKNTKMGAKGTITIAGKGDMTYTANLYFQKPAEWSGVNAYVWTGSGALAGYESYNTWPGAAVEADSCNPGWYSVSFSTKDPAGFNFIFNNGTGGQTSDLSTGELTAETNLWIVGDNVSTEMPQGFVDPNRTIHVPGTFPGPSWDAASNQMTYDPELGLYVYTFKDVAPANYEYKISVNGSWNENYGVNGAFDGGNIAVAVPGEMDVTVYYSDVSHRSVTSVTYTFADITLSGPAIPEGTKLTDPGLTGIYSVTVDMEAGSHEGVKLTWGEKVYEFTSVVVDKTGPVTFFFDPASELYYHNGAAVVDGTGIYFDSKDLAYKAPFGAVEQNTDVTFTITTGADATGVKLIIKGVATVEMEKTGEALAVLDLDGQTTAGDVKWTCTTSIPNIGEYDYYFAITNGNGVVCYGDDDGFYGTGTACQLTEVMPYDLVVYASGFETPDWMKNAVIYQIFPDRFYNGDTSNDKAQTTARGAVNYEFVNDWYLLPENPQQREKLSQSEYESYGAFYGDGEWSNEIYGGDLKGIVERIDYLKALGVNVIYLNPVFTSISNHRYDACDYTTIDPILGTEGDFAELVSVAEANGMHIILDGVFNHVSDDSIYFDRYYKFLDQAAEKYDGKIGAYPYWAYVYDYMADEGADKATAEAAAKEYFSENYGITDWSYTEWFEIKNETMKDGQGAAVVDKIGLRMGEPVYSYDGWWGYDSMPIIYSTNGSEYRTGNWAEEIINDPDGTGSVTEYWITEGNDGWRLDVANEVSDETWQYFRKSVKALDSDAVIIGEIWDDATKYLKGDMYDSVMNYLFRNAVTDFAKGTSAEDTTKALEKIRERYPEEAFYAMMNLVGSHDTSRVLSYLDGVLDDRKQEAPEYAFPTYEKTSQLAKDRQYLVAFTQFTYAGAPTIYYGDEIGMVGADDPDDRRAFEWGKGNEELVTWYATLAAIRAEYPALRTGSVEPFDSGDSNVMGYVRREGGETATFALTGGEALIVLANNSSNEKSVALNVTELGVEAEKLTDLITGETYAVAADGSVTASVEGLRGAILVPSENAQMPTVNKAALAPAYESKYQVAPKPTPATYTITATAGENGQISDEGETTLEEGFSATYWMKADDGYTVKAVLVDGENQGAITKYTFEDLDGDHTISVVFEAVKDEDDKPGEGGDSGDTDKPGEGEDTDPDRPDGNEPEEPEVPDEPAEPDDDDRNDVDTGDHSLAPYWQALTLISLAVLALLALPAVKRKH